MNRRCPSPWRTLYHLCSLFTPGYKSISANSVPSGNSKPGRTWPPESTSSSLSSVNRSGPYRRGPSDRRDRRTTPTARPRQNSRATSAASHPPCCSPKRSPPPDRVRQREWELRAGCPPGTAPGDEARIRDADLAGKDRACPLRPKQCPACPAAQNPSDGQSFPPPTAIRVSRGLLHQDAVDEFRRPAVRRSTSNTSCSVAVPGRGVMRIRLGGTFPNPSNRSARVPSANGGGSVTVAIISPSA